MNSSKIDNTSSAFNNTVFLDTNLPFCQFNVGYARCLGPGTDGPFANYRPFDRERDLQHPGTQTKSIGDMVKNAKSLHSRFTGGS